MKRSAASLSIIRAIRAPRRNLGKTPDKDRGDGGLQFGARLSSLLGSS